MVVDSHLVQYCRQDWQVWLICSIKKPTVVEQESQPPVFLQVPQFLPHLKQSKPVLKRSVLEQVEQPPSLLQVEQAMPQV